MRNLYLILTFSLAGTPFLSGQVTNDVCSTAIELTDLVSWCSQPAAFSNINAQDEAEVEKPFCFFDTPINKDVWFSFTAIGNTVNVAVTGKVESNQQDVGGSIEKPNIAL